MEFQEEIPLENILRYFERQLPEFNTENQDIEDVKRLFDPVGSNSVNFENFRRGVHKLLLLANDKLVDEAQIEHVADTAWNDMLKKKEDENYQQNLQLIEEKISQLNKQKEENASLRNRALSLEKNFNETDTRLKQAIRDIEQRHQNEIKKLGRILEDERSNLENKIEQLRNENNQYKKEINRLKLSSNALEDSKRKLEDRINFFECEQNNSITKLQYEKGILSAKNKKMEETLSLQEAALEEAHLELLELRRISQEDLKEDDVFKGDDEQNNHQIDESDSKQSCEMCQQLQKQGAETELGSILSGRLQTDQDKKTPLRGESLAAEIDSRSKDEILEALKREKENNQELKGYVNRLLIIIMEKSPELLEVIENKH